MILTITIEANTVDAIKRALSVVEIGLGVKGENLGKSERLGSNSQDEEKRAQNSYLLKYDLKTGKQQ